MKYLQLTEDLYEGQDFDWPAWLSAAWREKAFYYDSPHYEPAINTPEGVRRVDWDDYIIQGANGELRSCKPDVFEATYVAVADEFNAGFASGLCEAKPLVRD